MDISYLDSLRKNFVGNSNLSPSRQIEYFQSGASLGMINAFVGGGYFNKEEKDKIENMESFSAVVLEEKPSTKDYILYNGIHYKVVRYVKKADVYSIIAEKSSFKRGRGK